MPRDASSFPLQGKIFPRNLTARADYIVRGNPTSSRPESGVDNCYPGLEFDQRNLDKQFFSGLVFEFHRDDGGILHRIVPDGLPAQKGLTDADRPLYLWAMMGRTMLDQSDANPPAFFFFGLGGLDVWRRVHDLLPGRIAVLLGPTPGFSALSASTEVIRTMDRLRDAGESLIQREETGEIQSAIFVGDRARYLDEDGVIDVSAYAPGDLTRSLCAPWQYDFRDCGCFYWASNKPDLVAGPHGDEPYVNFQRKDRTISPAPADIPPADRDNWLRLRREQEFDYADLVAGAWNELPVVLNDRETEHVVPLPAPPVPRLMTRQEVIDELNYLATVEHALCIEYLYAHYSLNSPLALPQSGVDARIARVFADAMGSGTRALPSALLSDRTRHIFAAAYEIFRIGVDEMRHLRWVNEALDLLERPPSLGRAERIGRAFDRPFELKPLTAEQLQWFIDIEKPSQAINEGVDGMYVRLHTSIDRQPNLFPERERLVHLIKLIIDEGGDHYERFLAIQQHLASMSADEYLRPLAEPSPGSALATLQDLSDQNYAVLLGALQIAFSLGDRAGGVLLEQARRAMYNLHETNHHLAGKGVRGRFLLPAPAPARLLTPEEAHAHVDALAESMRAALEAVTDVGDSERALAERQRAVNEALFQRMHELIAEDLNE